jgi:transposase
LWRELRAQGFAGGKSIVRKHVARWRPTRALGAHAAPQREGGAAGAPSETRTRTWSVRTVTWLVLRDADDLDADEHAYLAELCRRCPEVGVAQGLAQDFLGIVRQRDEAALGPWVQVATASGVADLRRFAAGLLRDWAAGRAALVVPWSNGQTEGQVTRIKAIKRQMYGRARFDLLRRRFLGPG